ncbi:MAG: hypothetical protein MZU95_01535 [Desulfomicrobium escambiense]|nr:hypothetical protein [Desulfomicrobium escambiense]
MMFSVAGPWRSRSIRREAGEVPRRERLGRVRRPGGRGLRGPEVGDHGRARHLRPALAAGGAKPGPRSRPCGPLCRSSRPDVGAMPEAVIDGVTGSLVSPDEPEALAGRILELVRNAPMRAAMGLAGRRRYEQEYSPRPLYERNVREILAQIAAGRPVSLSRLRVLVSAYACHPLATEESFAGEAILGWNIVRQLCRFHDVTVLTRSYNRDALERGLKERGLEADCRYVTLPRALSPLLKHYLGFSLYYLFWQMRAFGMARRLVRESRFDVFHQVTFANDWMPSFIGAYLPMPFIWDRSAARTGPSGPSSRAREPLPAERVGPGGPQGLRRATPSAGAARSGPRPSSSATARPRPRSLPSVPSCGSSR